MATGTDTCATGSTDWGRMLDRPIYGLNDTATGYNCITNYLKGDVLVVRYAAPWEIGGITNLNCHEQALLARQSDRAKNSTHSSRGWVPNHHKLAQ